MQNIDEVQIETQLRRDEGEVLHEYKDSKGFSTIGIGVLIDSRKGGGITKEESSYLFQNRLKSKTAELVARFPWVAKLDSARMGVLVNMSYQMGVAGLAGFRKMLQAVQAGDWQRAAAEMKDSQWYRDTPARCDRLRNQMVTGIWQ